MKKSPAGSGSGSEIYEEGEEDLYFLDKKDSYTREEAGVRFAEPVKNEVSKDRETQFNKRVKSPRVTWTA